MRVARLGDRPSEAVHPAIQVAGPPLTPDTDYLIGPIGGDAPLWPGMVILRDGSVTVGTANDPAPGEAAKLPMDSGQTPCKR